MRVEEEIAGLQSANNSGSALMAIALLLGALAALRRRPNGPGPLPEVSTSVPENQDAEIPVHEVDNPPAERERLNKQRSQPSETEQKLITASEDLTKRIAFLPSDDPAREALDTELRGLRVQITRMESARSVRDARLQRRIAQLLVEQNRRDALVQPLRKRLGESLVSRATAVQLEGATLIVTMRNPVTQAEQKQFNNFAQQNGSNGVEVNGTTVRLTVPAIFWTDGSLSPSGMAGQAVRTELFTWLEGTDRPPEPALKLQFAISNGRPSPAPAPAPAPTPAPAPVPSPVPPALNENVDATRATDAVIAADGVEWRKQTGTDMWATEHENFHRTQHGETLVKSRLQASLSQMEIRRAETDRVFNNDRVIVRARNRDGQPVFLRRLYPYRWEVTTEQPKTALQAARELTSRQSAIPATVTIDTGIATRTDLRAVTRYRAQLNTEYLQRIRSEFDARGRSLLQRTPPAGLTETERKQLAAAIRRMDDLYYAERDAGRTEERLEKLERERTREQREKDEEEERRKQNESSKRIAESMEKARKELRPATDTVMQELEKSVAGGSAASAELLRRARGSIVAEMRVNEGQPRLTELFRLQQRIVELDLADQQQFYKEWQDLSARLDETRSAWEANPSGQPERKGYEDAGVAFLRFLEWNRSRDILRALQTSNRFPDLTTRIPQQQTQVMDALLRLRQHNLIDPAHQNINYQAENLVPDGTVRLFREEQGGTVRYTVWQKVGQGAVGNPFQGWRCLSDGNRALLGHALAQQMSIAQFRPNDPRVQRPQEGLEVADTQGNAWQYAGGQWKPLRVRTA